MELGEELMTGRRPVAAMFVTESRVWSSKSSADCIFRTIVRTPGRPEQRQRESGPLATKPRRAENDGNKSVSNCLVQYHVLVTNYVFLIFHDACAKVESISRVDDELLLSHGTTHAGGSLLESTDSK